MTRVKSLTQPSRPSSRNEHKAQRQGLARRAAFSRHSLGAGKGNSKFAPNSSFFCGRGWRIPAGNGAVGSELNSGFGRSSGIEVGEGQHGKGQSIVTGSSFASASPYDFYESGNGGAGLSFSENPEPAHGQHALIYRRFQAKGHPAMPINPPDHFLFEGAIFGRNPSQQNRDGVGADLADGKLILFNFLGSRAVAGPKIAQPVCQVLALVNRLVFAWT